MDGAGCSTGRQCSRILGKLLLQDSYTHYTSAPVKADDRTFLESLRAATDFLESIASHRELLEGVPAEERERLHRAIAEAGFRPRGRHHEIYLGDPRRAAPDKLRTILRQPIE